MYDNINNNTIQGVYPIANTINHCCKPNTSRAIHNDNKSVVVKAIKQINKGDETTYDYVSKLSGITERQITLYDKYGFVCVCATCVGMNNEHKVTSTEINNNNTTNTTSVSHSTVADSSNNQTSITIPQQYADKMYIGHTANMYLGLYSKQPYKAGDVILHNIEPYLYHYEKCCAYCSYQPTSIAELVKCDKCHYMYYCSQPCQTAHYN